MGTTSNLLTTCWATPSAEQHMLAFEPARPLLRNSTGSARAGIFAPEVSTRRRLSSYAGRLIENSSGISGLSQKLGSLSNHDVECGAERRFEDEAVTQGRPQQFNTPTVIFEGYHLIPTFVFFPLC